MSDINSAPEPDIFSRLKDMSEDAYLLATTKTKEGFFDSHQTAGNLKALAKDLLAKSGFRSDSK